MIPTTNHLNRAYFELGKIGARAVGMHKPWPYKPNSTEELLALCADMSRHDPRLFELLIQWIMLHWEEINWLHLRRAILKIESPQVFGVIGEILSNATSNPELENCFRYLMHKLKPAPTQFFYHLLYTPGSPLAVRTVDARLKEFERWGYLASSRPTLNADSKQTAGTMSRTSRLNCLKELVAKKGTIQLRDYISALPHPISRQQALLDITSIKGIRRSGTGRGSRWVLRAATATK